MLQASVGADFRDQLEVNIFVCLFFLSVCQISRAQIEFYVEMVLYQGLNNMLASQQWTP